MGSEPVEPGAQCGSPGAVGIGRAVRAQAGPSSRRGPQSGSGGSRNTPRVKRKVAAVNLWICVLHRVGAAQDPPAQPLTAEQAADAALKALAGEDSPDPWLVADELCYRGEYDVAERFDGA